MLKILNLLKVAKGGFMKLILNGIGLVVLGQVLAVNAHGMGKATPGGLVLPLTLGLQPHSHCPIPRGRFGFSHQQK
jgi:hypothetical protein